MNDPEIAVIILAAGKGTRMKSDLPKVLHAVGNFPMLHHVQEVARTIGATRRVVVTAPGMESVQKAARGTDPECVCVIQQEQRGTADAVRAAEGVLKEFSGVVLVLYGDTPLLRAETLSRLLATLGTHTVAVLGMRPHDPAEYGRLVLNARGDLERIVEYRDATPEERAVPLCNSGVMAVRGARIFPLLEQVKNNNAKGEYYLTDLVALARGEGGSCGVAEAEEEELLGVNSRVELAEAEKIFQCRRRTALMEAGVTLLDPDSVYFSADTEIGRDTRIEPHVFFAPGVQVGEECHIKAFCHLEGAVIGARVALGPFARLRPGTHLEGENKIGNFVEVKNATLRRGAQASHLAYLGDAEIGEDANIGAGSVTCNYDGYRKHRTTIGAGAFIGSNTALVAPVVIGAGAIIGAGSVITSDVAPDALAFTRPEKTEKPDGAKNFRLRHEKP
jgi:bifunctional UDP-N-acetylglucosamine pyrophosphorylase/glucosamine-1-phosphate N-acetyltransferase